jgi:hypothetical protein
MVTIDASAKELRPPDRSFFNIYSWKAAKPTLEQEAPTAEAAGTSPSRRIRRFASAHGTPGHLHMLRRLGPSGTYSPPGLVAGRRLRHGNKPVTGLYFAGTPS